MRVDAKHAGKKGKCPTCGTVNLIKKDEGLDDLPVAHPITPPDDLPVAQPIQTPPSTPLKPADPFQNPAPGNPFQQQPQPFTSSDFNTGASPYRPPTHTGKRQQANSGETDVCGILSVVLGGLNLLGIALCICFGPILLAVILGSIGGIVLSLWAKRPLKAIGMSLNGVALGISLLIVIAAVVLYFFAINQVNNQAPPGFPNF